MRKGLLDTDLPIYHRVTVIQSKRAAIPPLKVQS